MWEDNFKDMRSFKRPEFEFFIERMKLMVDWFGFAEMKKDYSMKGQSAEQYACLKADVLALFDSFNNYDHWQTSNFLAFSFWIRNKPARAWEFSEFDELEVAMCYHPYSFLPMSERVEMVDSLRKAQQFDKKMGEIYKESVIAYLDSL